jgi:hypothetical protein
VRPAEPGAADSAPPPAAVAETFAGWLATRRLSARTRATYAQRVGQFLAWLAAGGGGEVAGDPLGDSEAFTDAARDWRRELLATRRRYGVLRSVSVENRMPIVATRAAPPIRLGLAWRSRRACSRGGRPNRD